MHNQKTFSIWMKRAFYLVRLSKWRLYAVEFKRIPTIPRMDIAKWLPLYNVLLQMVELYHSCISTTGVSIYWDGMLVWKIMSKRHLHGQLKAGLIMNWDWNGWKRTLRNIL